MPNTAPVLVPITIDNQTATGIQAAVSSLKQFEQQGTSAGVNVSRAFDSAKGSAALFGQEIGVPVNRYLRQVLASSELLAPILQAAFPVAAAVGFATVIFDLGKKIYDFANGVGDAAKQTETLSDNLKKMAEVAGQIDKQTQDARTQGSLIGLSGSGRDSQELDNLNNLLVENQQKIRDTKDSIFGLQNGFINFDTSVVSSHDQIVKLQGTLGDLTSREQLLEQQLANTNSQFLLDQKKEYTEELKRQVEQLIQLNHQLDAFNQLQAKALHAPLTTTDIGSGFAGARGNPDVLPPQLTSLAVALGHQPSVFNQDDLKALELYTAGLGVVIQKTTELSGVQKSLDQTISHSFDSFFGDIATGTKSIGEDFASLAESVAGDVLKMVANLLILPPILQGINALLGAVGLGSGFIPGGKSDIPLFGGIGGLQTTIPGRASGGPVMPNSLYLVGERGPEFLRTGSTSGFVSPGGSGAQNIQVNIINQSSQPVSAKASSRFDGNKYVTSVVLQDLSNGGPIRQALSGQK